jgi:predicted Zn finger-like uncharacterized protein
MAQATRCPHCQTAFKVVRDQLLLREGWVRCGHCGEPFNALDHLIDLTPAPPPAPAEPQAPAKPTPPPEAQPEPQASTVPVTAGLRWSNIPLDQPTYQGFLPLTVQAYDLAPQAPTEQEPARGEEAEPDEALTPAEWPDDPLPEDDLVTDEISPSQAALDPDAAPLSEFNLNDALNYQFESEDRPQNAPALAAKPVEAEPGFIRKARRQAFWSSTPARAALAVISLLLLLVLAAQAALTWRDTLAQQYPNSRPWLQQLCQMTSGCELSAPRDLDALVIDSSTLSPADSGLQLSVLLRNRSDRAVAWPALELTLTNAQDMTLQRKVVQAAQYLPEAQATHRTLTEGLAAGQQVQLRLHLEVNGAAPAGYKLVLFYP